MRVFFRSCADALWSALSSLARLGLAVVSADSSERAAQRRLREEFGRIRLTEADQRAAKVKGSWESNGVRLHRDVLSRDPRGFLTWDVIRETMFPPPYAAFVRTELDFLRQHDWDIWRRAMKERPAGLPFPCLFHPSSSANAIHHAYHLSRFEVETGLKVRDFGAILEFGGGYGSLCRIVHALGFAAQYSIFDLPEQSALQRYYLSTVGISNVLLTSEIERLRGIAGAGQAPRLFVGTWSLSESPLQLRKELAEVVRGFDAFLIAYQREFGGVDNRAFFREWQGWFDDVSWTVRTIDHMLPSTYLFGVARSEIAGRHIAHWS